jgi:flagellar assembly factor FliW
MVIKTKAFGEVEISEKQRIFFKEGLFGFEDMHHFVLLDTEAGSPFYWLQSEEVSDIAFLIIEPKIIMPEYKLESDKKDLEDINIETEDDILIFSIVTIYDNPQNITANLLGPIVINRFKHLGKQIISLNDSYSVRYPLLNGKGEKC